MTQYCVGTSAEDGGHPAGSVALADVTYAVDTLLNAAQLPSCNPPLDGTSAHSKCQ